MKLLVSVYRKEQLQHTETRGRVGKQRGCWDSVAGGVRNREDNGRVSQEEWENREDPGRVLQGEQENREDAFESVPDFRGETNAVSKEAGGMSHICALKSF